MKSLITASVCPPPFPKISVTLHEAITDHVTNARAQAGALNFSIIQPNAIPFVGITANSQYSPVWDCDNLTLIVIE